MNLHTMMIAATLMTVTMKNILPFLITMMSQEFLVLQRPVHVSLPFCSWWAISLYTLSVMGDSNLIPHQNYFNLDLTYNLLAHWQYDNAQIWPIMMDIPTHYSCNSFEWCGGISRCHWRPPWCSEYFFDHLVWIITSCLTYSSWDTSKWTTTAKAFGCCC